ncbi:alpha/beta hydrolase [Melioribacter sp. OK-6-Me]|uniref:alpha/beta hydrolase n=1 Tax=unclassified Melioribacter TaxID=2627329 RepID=UPI003ED8742A
MKATSFVTLVLLFFLAFVSNAQEIINLYSGDIPNSRKASVKEEYTSGIYRGVTNPTLEIYLPDKEKSNGTAVIICPGGAYGVVVYQAEGVRTAKELAKSGVTAFVLKYRIPDDATMIDKKIGPLQDAQQAIKVVREGANKWGIDTNKIGIMGFSAGGHLAATAATHYKHAYIENVNNSNLRPDFLILIYPVISMQDELTHLDSRKNLLGSNPSQDIIQQFSNELQVDSNTPPTYITHAGDDRVVTVDNSIIFYKKLQQNNVPAELHIYPRGNHGFVFLQPAEEWITPILKWLRNIYK